MQCIQNIIPGLMVSLVRLMYALASSEASLALSISCKELDQIYNSIQLLR